MQLANQASQLLLALAAISQLFGIVRFTLNLTLFSKYGHFWLQKNKMVTAQMKTQGFKTSVHKPTEATSTIYTVYSINTLSCYHVL